MSGQDYLVAKQHFLSYNDIEYSFSELTDGRKTMNNGNNSKIEMHRLKPEDIKATIHIDSGDYYILKVYKGVLKAPMRSVLHFMIGRAAKCWEEKHDQQIADLNERVRIQAKIIVTYMNKYGPLHIKR